MLILLAVLAVIAVLSLVALADATKALVATENVAAAINQIAQTTLRKVVGQHTLDEAEWEKRAKPFSALGSFPSAWFSWLSPGARWIQTSLSASPMDEEPTWLVVIPRER